MLDVGDKSGVEGVSAEVRVEVSTIFLHLGSYDRLSLHEQ